MSRDPQFGVDRACALAQEREVALVELREHRVGGPVDADAGGEAVVAGDLRGGVAIGYVGERPGPTRHPQVLQPVLGEHDQRRGARRRESRLDPGDSPREDRLDRHVDGQALPEVDGAAVEEQKARRRPAVRAPVTDLQLAVVESVHVLADAHLQLAAGQRWGDVAVDHDRRARGLKSVVVAGHQSACSRRSREWRSRAARSSSSSTSGLRTVGGFVELEPDAAEGDVGAGTTSTSWISTAISAQPYRHACRQLRRTYL